MSKLRLHRLAFMLAAFAAIGGCAGDAPEDAPKSDEIVAVRVIVAQPASENRSVGAVGTVRYRRETPLGFTTAGRVANVRFNEGDRVSQGALLAALDTTNVQGDLAAANAEATRAEAELSRISTLYEQGWVTKGQLDQTQAAAEAARARTSQAGFSADTARIYAPSSGVVLSRNVDPGQVVAAGTPALVIGQNDGGFVLRAPFTSGDATRLTPGMTGEVSLDGLDAPISGVLTEVEGRAEDATGSFIAVFALPANGRLKSGQIGSVRLTLPAESSGNGAVAVPATALFDVRAGEALVWVVETNGRVSPRSVTIGGMNARSVQVTAGLRPGERVVVAGGERLQKGTRVRVSGPDGPRPETVPAP
ncbi:efflux RND transporter periplasmic adaptor subunit [Novosphingopyxis sp.]|uniref:efflux RND transporter periplasmic adaptor subunit n=1 Tax=Novosphingopyxis sp. TaxID=2709690 RepID=UPI003B5A49FB